MMFTATILLAIVVGFAAGVLTGFMIWSQRLK